MALTNLKNLRAGGGTHLAGDAAIALHRALGELQGLRLNIATGNVNANTDITLTGAAVADTTIIAVLEQDSTSGVLAAHAGTVTVTAANTIRSTAATTGKNLLVLWTKKPA